MVKRHQKVFYVKEGQENRFNKEYKAGGNSILNIIVHNFNRVSSIIEGTRYMNSPLLANNSLRL